MTASEIAADLRKFTGAGMISAKKLAEYMDYKDQWRVAERFLRDDPDSAVPILSRLGTRYFIRDVAIRIHEQMEV